jgi:hypothetical protein
MLQEASEDTIELHDDDPVYLERMLKFFYTLEADSYATVEKMAFIDPIHLYALADKYQAENLKKWAVTHLKSVMSTKGIWFKKDVLFEILDVHYSQCVTIQDSLSRCLVEWFKGHDYSHWDTKSDELLELLRKYPVMGADMFLSTR